MIVAPEYRAQREVEVLWLRLWRLCCWALLRLLWRSRRSWSRCRCGNSRCRRLLGLRRRKSPSGKCGEHVFLGFGPCGKAVLDALRRRIDRR
jgi:hypothetical protein